MPIDAVARRAAASQPECEGVLPVTSHSPLHYDPLSLADCDNSAHACTRRCRRRRLNLVPVQIVNASVDNRQE
eukprot:6209700-Pleurochrysis_carterae.AAC.1